jgi:DNA-binding GntR family transcriptional regulator
VTLEKSAQRLRSPNLRPVERESIVENVAREIRRSVLVGVLRPGQSCSIAELSAQLHVSPIPVREALRRLESEGLVLQPGGRGWQIAPLEELDLKEIYQARELIEPVVLRRAVPLYTAAQLNAIEACFEGMSGQADEPEHDEFWNAHRAFHHSLIEPALSARLGRFVETLWHATERYHRLFLANSDVLVAPMQSHARLMDAARRRDARAASRELKSHLRENEEILLSRIRAYNLARGAALTGELDLRSVG